MSTDHSYPSGGFGRVVPPGEAPESYLRRFTEAQLRRLAAGETTAADCASRVDAVAAAFEGTGVLDGEQAEDIAADLDVALAARSPERGTLLHAGRRAQVSALRGETGFARIFARSAQMRARGIGEGGDGEDPPAQALVVPAGAVLRLRHNGVDEDVYLLSYVATSGRAWLSVAARTSEPRIPRRHASPPSTRNPRVRQPSPKPSTFAGNGLTAVDDAGRTYSLGFSGGGGHWYLGRLSVFPAPPPGVSWLEVRSGGESARLDLTARPPAAEVTVRAVARGAGEAYLLRRAESLLGFPGAQAGLVAAEVTGLASAVPALRAVGMLPDDSPIPGQLATLAERMGAPGRMIAEPGELPERWAGVLDAGGCPADADAGGPIAMAVRGIGSTITGGMAMITGGMDADDHGPVAAAHLAAVLPEADGVAVQLAGLVTLPGAGTLIFGGVRAWSKDGGQSLWLRDDAGRWHAVSIRGWSSNGSSYTFQAAVVPPVGPDTSRVEFYVTGTTTEVRAAIPLTWWTS
jgi:hypothetical protein